MIVHGNIQQGSREWRELRAGIPTASEFAVLMTAEARKGKLTKGAASYMHKLLGEWMLDDWIEDGASGGFVGRGKEMEEEAKAHYEFTRDTYIEPIGFVTTDDERIGCSPDGFIGVDGLIEVKCYSLQNHIGALLQADSEHQAQVQGGLWITERVWCDRLYYNPLLPPVTVRFERDDDYIADLQNAVLIFLGHLEAAKARLIEMGCCAKGKP